MSIDPGHVDVSYGSIHELSYFCRAKNGDVTDKATLNFSIQETCMLDSVLMTSNKIAGTNIDFPLNNGAFAYDLETIVQNLGMCTDTTQIVKRVVETSVYAGINL